MTRPADPTVTSRTAGRYAPPPAAGAADSRALQELAATPVEARAFPSTPIAPEDVRGRGWTQDDLWQPVVVLRWDAVEHNADKMAGWCADRGMSLAPHGKTTMAPQLWDVQLRRGAWGITAASAAQARVMRRFGVPRILIANEVGDPHSAAWLAHQQRSGDAEVYCLVDSERGVELLEQACAAAGADRALPVLVELGVPGRRTGCRTVEELLALAERAGRSGRLRVAGVEGYEGVLATRRDDEHVSAARQWLAGLTAAAGACDSAGLLTGDERIVSAGGSGYFDLVADAIDAMGNLSAPIRPVLRSGCYLTHDHGSYERSSPWRSAAGSDAGGDPLRPALVAYATVLSAPEDGRALAGAGRRDLPYDQDLPMVLGLYRDGAAVLDPEQAAKVRVSELADQHVFLDTSAVDVRVGDVVELGLSHPCTTFDKWPLLPVVDRAGTVVDAVRTLF